MNTESNFESRIRILEDIEAIKRLKGKYWTSVDSHNWEALAECMTEDLILKILFSGRWKAVISLLKS